MDKESLVTIGDAFAGVKVFKGSDLLPPKTIVVSKDLFEIFKNMSDKQTIDWGTLDEVKNALASMLEHP